MSFTTPYDYKLIAVTVSADRLSESIDITNVIAQLDIYEDINKPFLVGNLAISNDNRAIISQINFIGTEKINIRLSLQSHGGRYTPKEIEKNFIITQLESSEKINDDASVIVLEMIEDSGYRNYLENVNKVYEGSGTQIVANCLADFIGKDLESSDGDNISTSPFKIIVPNWHPFEVVSWVKSLMVKEFGFPYYFYSTIHSDNIIQNNLMNMLQQPAVNTMPYVYSTAAAASSTTDSILQQSFVIANLDVNKGLSVLNKIREGNVGSSNQQIDMVKNSSSREIKSFSVYDMFKRIKDVGGIKLGQAHMTYDGRATVNGKNLHKYNSRRISEIQVSGIYDNGVLNSTDVVPLENKLVAKAISSWMQSGKITIRVPGRNFLGTSNRGPIQLGDNIKVQVHSSKNTANHSAAPDYDKGLSGEYIIQTIRHMFILQKYHVVAECSKLTDELNNNEKII